MKFPEKCPHCGKDISDNKSSVVYRSEPYSYSKNSEIRLQTHECPHCKNAFFVFKTLTYMFDLCHEQVSGYYPVKYHGDYPERVKKLSQNAYDIYSEAYAARKCGFELLASAGLRMALEWLVWDYLIVIKGKKQEEIEPLKLKSRTDMMESSEYIDICTNLLRLYGNDNIHITKILDLTLTEAFSYFDLLVRLIDEELQLPEHKSRLDEYNKLIKEYNQNLKKSNQGK